MAELAAPEQMEGKTVRCSACQTHFILRAEHVRERSPSGRSWLVGLLLFLFLGSIVALGATVTIAVAYRQEHADSAAALAKMETDLATRTRHLAAKEEQLTKLASRIDDTVQSEIHRRGAKLEGREETVAKKEVTLSRKEESLVAREAALNRTIDDAVARREADLARRLEAVAKREAEVNKTVAEAIAKKEAAVSEQEQRLAKKEVEVNQRIENGIAGEKEELSRLTREARAKVRDLEKQQAALAEERDLVRAERIAALDREAAPLLQTALKLAQKGFTDAACQRLKQIVEKYPDTPTAKVAQANLDKLQR
jgi:hypothetical protein